MNARFRCSVLLPLFVTVPLFAAGLEMTMEQTRLDKKEAPLTTRMYVQGVNVATQMLSEKGAGTTTIFRGDKELMWIVNDGKKEYTQMTRQDLEQMAATMNSAMAQMKAQMADMPPEQRAMMEKMMGGAAPAAGGPSRPVYTRTAESKTISGFPCVKYDVTLDGARTSEMWVTPFDKVPDFKEAAPAFEAMAKFFKTMFESFKDNAMAKTLDNPYGHTNEVKGFPILTVRFSDGTAESEMLVKSIASAAIDESRFNPPAGYALKESPMAKKKGK